MAQFRSGELDVLEDERQYPAADVEQKITVPDSNRRILTEIKRYADEHEREYGRFPKTLIFAAQDLPHRSHADQLVVQARETPERLASMLALTYDVFRLPAPQQAALARRLLGAFAPLADEDGLLPCCMGMRLSVCRRKAGG